MGTSTDRGRRKKKRNSSQEDRMKRMRDSATDSERKGRKKIEKLNVL